MERSCERALFFEILEDSRAQEATGVEDILLRPIERSLGKFLRDCFDGFVWKTEKNKLCLFCSFHIIRHWFPCADDFLAFSGRRHPLAGKCFYLIAIYSESVS